VQSKLAHTAEHAFIGSLQKLKGKTLDVRKVEHGNYDNLVIIATANLDIDTLMEAQREVNSLINQGKKIIIHTFTSLEEAKRSLPNLRANEDRIRANEQVRVVEIEDHDIAACVMDHASNLKECGLFLITRINRTGSDCEVNFVVAESAKHTTMELSRKILNLCQETGANYNTIEETVKKLRQLNKIYFEKARIVTEQILDNIKSMPSYKSGPGIVSGSFIGLLDQQIREFASRKTAEPNMVVIIANLGVESDSCANLVLARSKSLQNIDCNELFREISSEWGKGGGKPEFVNGVVKREHMYQSINAIIEKIQTCQSI
jgi:alanyl-tRNA synthetase